MQTLPLIAVTFAHQRTPLSFKAVVLAYLLFGKNFSAGPETTFAQRIS
jgi:hypothetical protein